MKHCPSCKTNYADDTLQFCLQDGTQLVDLANGDAPTVAYIPEQETVIRTKPPAQVVPLDTPNFQVPQNWQTNPSDAGGVGGYSTNFPTEPKKSNTLAVVLLTALGMLLLFGIGVGAWLYLRDGRQVAVNVNSANNRPSNANSAANNQNSNTPTPTATPTPKPTLKPEEAKNVVAAVEDVVDDWKDATENLQLDRHMENYADTVDYYKGGKTSFEKIRGDRERAFAQYDAMDVNISNLKITPDGSGEKATAVFDKEWTFEGVEKFTTGKVQQQLTLGKFDGKWLITGEKDLKVYYVEK